MDLVLEVADHYVLDDLYAKVLPASLAANIPVKWQKLLGLNSGFSNSTILQETLNSKNAVKECRRFYGQVPFLFDMSTTSFASLLPRSSILREFLSLWVIVTIFGLLLYLFTASLSYVFVFDKSIFNHPRYLKNQMAMEIKLAVSAIPWMSMLTAPWFVMELNGHSKLYMKIDYENHGVRKLIIEYFTFIFFY
ncbi:Erg3p [Saccharomyces cerevisiae VL3]|nr:Erg3p [Saccharomyces cerevisiae VL3]